MRDEIAGIVVGAHMENEPSAQSETGVAFAIVGSHRCKQVVRAVDLDGDQLIRVGKVDAIPVPIRNNWVLGYWCGQSSGANPLQNLALEKRLEPIVA